MGILINQSDVAGTTTSSGGGGAPELTLAQMFLDGRVDEALREADRLLIFNKLIYTLSGLTLRDEATTFASALSDLSDRTKIYKNDTLLTEIWKSRSGRAAFDDTAYGVISRSGSAGVSWSETLSPGFNGQYSFFANSGLYLYHYSSSVLYRETLSVAYDPSTIISGQQLSVNSPFSGLYDWDITPDGTGIISVNNTSIQYAVMSTPFDITSMGLPVSFTAYTGTQVRGVSIHHDGSKLTYFDGGNDGFYELDFGTANDITTLVQNSIVMRGEDMFRLASASSRIYYGNEGLALACPDNANDSVSIVLLETAYDPDSAYDTFTVIPEYFSSQSSVSGVWLDKTSARFAISYSTGYISMITPPIEGDYLSVFPEITSSAEAGLVVTEVPRDHMNSSYAGIDVSEDGMHLLIVMYDALGGNNYRVYAYRLSTPFDFSTAVYHSYLSLGSDYRWAMWGKNGQSVILWNQSTHRFSQAFLSIPYDLDTSRSYEFNDLAFFVYSQEATCLAAQWANGGKYFYVLYKNDQSELEFNRFETNKPYILHASMTKTTVDLDTLAHNYRPNAIRISEDGLKLDIITSYSDQAYLSRLEFGTAFDISTLSSVEDNPTSNGVADRLLINADDFEAALPASIPADANQATLTEHVKWAFSSNMKYLICHGESYAYVDGAGVWTVCIARKSITSELGAS